jgi:putative 16S rRNA processing protein RimM
LVGGFGNNGTPLILVADCIVDFARGKRLGRLSESGFFRQIRGRSPRYGRLNLIRYIGLFKNHKGRLKTGFHFVETGFQTTSDVIPRSVI